MDKQALFLQNYFDNTDRETFLNAYKSALKAGYSESVARSITGEINRGKYRKIERGLQTLKRQVIPQEEAERNEEDVPTTVVWDHAQ